MLLAENFVLSLEKNFLLLSLRFLACFFHNAAGQIVGLADALGGHMPLYADAQQRAGHKTDQREGVNNDIIHDNSCNMLTGKTRYVRNGRKARRIVADSPRSERGGRIFRLKGEQVRKKEKEPGMP